MNVGEALLHTARATGASTIAVVGTGKNVGKTTALRAMYTAALQAGLQVGLLSVGRDGEAFDAVDERNKPRLFLSPGTVIATARDVLPHSPASEILAITNAQTPAGRLIYARVMEATLYELVGPPTASAVREAIGELRERCELVLVDGAVDRVAALAGGDDAVIVACGAAAAATEEEVVEGARALVERLRIPIADERAPYLRIQGALTPGVAAQLIARDERRQIVVRDATHVALTGKVAVTALARLRVRTERPLRVAAATVASVSPERAFDPRSFAAAVARATRLPTYDVYAGTQVA